MLSRQSASDLVPEAELQQCREPQPVRVFLAYQEARQLETIEDGCAETKLGEGLRLRRVVMKQRRGHQDLHGAGCVRVADLDPQSSQQTHDGRPECVDERLGDSVRRPRELPPTVPLAYAELNQTRVED